VRIRAIAIGAASSALLAVALGGVAHARNPHCAGGIQYVVQGLRDKDKGNTEDYLRQMGKAIQQLTQCQEEDPKDFEALGYLGWAYAELDSTRPAGLAFDKSIAGLTAAGDKKKIEWAKNNQMSYWATKFNEGVAKMRDGQALEEGAQDKAGAQKLYDAAIASLTQASELRVGDAGTMRSLGTAWAFKGDFTRAEGVLREAAKLAPTDTTIAQTLNSVRTNMANGLLEEKKFDEAIAAFEGMVASEPKNPNLYLGLADAHFRKAQSLQGDARKPEFKAAAQAYAKAAAVKPGDADLPFNSALAYQNAGEWKSAVEQWHATLKVRPDDTDAMSALGAALAELQQFNEAIQVLHKAVLMKPKEKGLHRQLGAVYTKAGNNAKSTEELMVYLALHNGQPVSDAAARAKEAPAASAAGKQLATGGSPDQIVPWEVDNEKIESWFYWEKHQAFHFKAGSLYAKSDWSQADAKTAQSGAKN
jgi:tetratricopeptide (TPR) repeat protein